MYWVPLFEINVGWVSENYLRFSRVMKWFHREETCYDEEYHKGSIATDMRILASRMIASLYSTIAMISTRENTGNRIRKTDRNIKLFLTSVDEIDKMKNHYNDILNNVPRKAIWVSKYNLLSLLNVPDAMRKFDCPVNLWEESTHGERYFQYVKPKITSVQLRNWQTNMHKNLLEDISMDRMVLECTSESESYHLMRYLRMVRIKKKCIKSIQRFLCFFQL